VVDNIIQYVKDSGGIQYANEQMTKYQNDALKILDNFKDSVYKRSLADLVRFTIERTK
jgi:octaprenyl-diphosphate synthase